MLRRIALITLVLGLAVAALGSGTARAQGIYPRNYALSCTGNACSTASCTSSFPVALVGRLLFSSPLAGTGSFAVNANFGNSIIPSAAAPFSFKITNGTASEKSVGGNAVPVGCFTAQFTVPNFPPLATAMGCYSDTEHDFDLVPLVKSAGTFSCHAKEM